MSIPIVYEGTVKQLYTQEEVDELLKNAGSGSSDSSNERNLCKVFTVTSTSKQQKRFNLLELMTIDESDINYIKNGLHLGAKTRVTQPGESGSSSDLEISEKNGVVTGLYIWATFDPTKPVLISFLNIGTTNDGVSSYKYNTLLIANFLNV